MTRLSLAAVAAIAALSITPQPAAAREAPWCVESYFPWGLVTQECSFWSFEACVPHANTGNRGFCIRNPAYEGPPPRWRHKRRARRR